MELPLTCAQISDPDNIGLEYWNADQPPNDARSAFTELRIRCYGLVLDSLTVFEEASTQRSTSSVSISGDLEVVRSHAYELAFSSEDEMFHSTMYDWLITRNLADDLLEVCMIRLPFQLVHIYNVIQMRPAFLEAHLKRNPVTEQKYQLLWQFYVKNDQPLRAAEVLGALAESTQYVTQLPPFCRFYLRFCGSFNLNLDVRLEYLTLAVANAKSHPISATGRHETAIAFLTDLEEKLDVAQVQLEIYNTLLPHVNDAQEVGDRIKLLSTRLFTMTEVCLTLLYFPESQQSQQLYQGYAIPFDMPALKLLCLHVSEHRDESIVRPIWNQIFDEGTSMHKSFTFSFPLTTVQQHSMRGQELQIRQLQTGSYM